MRGAVVDNGITGTEGFRKFLRACAAFAGQLVNYQDLALAAGVSGVTAKEGVNVLQPMGIIQLLEPYSVSRLKRLIRTPKLYLIPGFARTSVPGRGEMCLCTGRRQDTFTKIPHYAYSRENARFSFYRDKDQREIDLIVESNAVLHPLELKKGIRRNAR